MSLCFFGVDGVEQLRISEPAMDGERRAAGEEQNRGRTARVPM